MHCNAGLSRSSTIVIAYLMKKYQISFIDAYDYLRDRRRFAKPNKCFIGLLSLYGKHLS